jgi:GNAT superfamily N-acetyltransferase
MAGSISTRAVRPAADADFVRSVYASTRSRELAVLGWPAAERDAFVNMQFDAQSRHYRNAFPDASYSIICVGGQPAGRLIVNRCADEIRIVDIALLPEFRRCGVGRELVERLLAEAHTADLPVRCQVLAGNDARRFWERLGFTSHPSEGVYVPMERSCRTSQR